jgi:hypothetical protein
MQQCYPLILFTEHSNEGHTRDISWAASDFIYTMQKALCVGLQVCSQVAVQRMLLEVKQYMFQCNLCCVGCGCKLRQKSVMPYKQDRFYNAEPLCEEAANIYATSLKTV